MKPNATTSLVEHHPGLNRRLSIQSIESSISGNNSGGNSPRGSSSSNPASPIRSNSSGGNSPRGSSSSNPASPLRSSSSGGNSPRVSSSSNPFSPIRSSSSGGNSPRGSSSSNPTSPIRKVVQAPMLSALWVSKSPNFENLERFSPPNTRAGVISRSQHLSPSFEKHSGPSTPTTTAGGFSRAQLMTVWRAKSMPSLEQEESPQLSVFSSPVHKSGSITSSPRSSRRSSFSSRRSFSMETEQLSHDLSVSDPDSPSRSTSHISANHRNLMARRQRSKSCVSQFMPSVRELKGLFDKDTNENNIQEDPIFNDKLANLNIEIEETNPTPTKEEKPKSKKKDRRVTRHQSLIKWEPRLSEDHLGTKNKADIEKLQFSPVKSMLLQFEKKPTPKKASNLCETKIVEIVENNNSTIDIKGRSRASTELVYPDSPSRSTTHISANHRNHYENKENEAPIIRETNKTTENMRENNKTPEKMQPNTNNRNENNSGLSSVRKLRLQWEKTVKEKNSSSLSTQQQGSPQKIQINKQFRNLNVQKSFDQSSEEEVFEIDYKEKDYKSQKEKDLTNNNKIKEDLSETDHNLNEHIISVYKITENIPSEHTSVEAKSVEKRAAAGPKSTEQLPKEVLDIPSVRNLRQQFEAVVSTPSYNKTEGLDEQPHHAAVKINNKVKEFEKCGKQSGEEDQRMSGSKIVRVPSTSIKSLRLQFERSSKNKENNSQESSRTSSPSSPISPASPTSPTSPISPIATSPRSPLSTSNILARSMTDSGTSMTMEISSSSADIFNYNENVNLTFSDHDIRNNNTLLQEDLGEKINENNNDTEIHEKNQAVNEYWKQQENERRKKEEEKQMELKKFKEMRKQKKIDEDQDSNLRRKREEKQQEFLNKIEINDKKNKKIDLERDNNQINTKKRDINSLRNKFENKNIKSEEQRLDNDKHLQHNSEITLRREKSKNISEKSRKLNPDELSFFKDFSTTGNPRTTDSDSLKTTDEHTSVSENNRLSYMSVDDDIEGEEENKKIDKYFQEREQFMINKGDRNNDIDKYLSQKQSFSESEQTNLNEDAHNTDNRIASVPSIHMNENNNFSNNEDLDTIEETSDDETSENISQHHSKERKLSNSKFSDCDRTNGNIETHTIVDQNINEKDDICHNDEKIKVDERKAELQKFKELRESMRKKKNNEKEAENEQKGLLEDARSSLEKVVVHIEKDIEQEHSNTNSPRTSPSKSLTRSPSKSSSKSSSRSSSRSGSQISLPGNCRPLNGDEMKFFMGTPSNEPFLRTQSLRVNTSKSKTEGSGLSILKEKKRRSSSFAERSTSNLSMATTTQRKPRIEAPPPPKNLPQGCRQLRADEMKFFFGGSSSLSTNINIYSSNPSVAEEEEDFISEA